MKVKILIETLTSLTAIKMEVRCPFCGSSLVFKAGFRVTRPGERVQRYLCRVCLRRFSSNPPVAFINKNQYDSGSREEEESELPAGENENMSSSEGAVTNSILLQKPGTGQDKELEGKLISFAWHLKKQNRAEKTIKNYVWMLRLLAKHGASLENPESIKETLAKVSKSDRWKSLAVDSYSAYLKMKGLHWEAPKFRKIAKLPFIPTEAELDTLITGCGPKASALLQLLKETGMRVGEALRLTWKNVDLERSVILLNEPEKGSNPRIFRISPKLIGMLNALPKNGERIFPMAYNSIKSSFTYSKRRLARKLNNPRLLNITFHTFRHWKGTMEYHKTRDIMHVKELLGHRNIQNTMTYVQVEKALFGENSDEFTVKVAKDPQEIQKLLETGFEYVCEKDGLLFFRKRK